MGLLGIDDATEQQADKVISLLQQIATALGTSPQATQQNLAQLYSTTPTSTTSGGTSTSTSDGTSFQLSESVTVNAVTADQLVSALRMHTRGDIKEDNWQVAVAANGGQASFQVRNNQGAGITILASALATYQNAEVIFYSGNNAGVRSTIASITSSGGTTTINLNDNLPQNVNVADELIVVRPVATSVDLVTLETITNQASGTNFASFVAPFAGTATVQINLATNSVLSLSAKPSGGTAVVATLNDGASITAGDWQTFQFSMAAGATYALQVGTTQVGALGVSIEGAMK